MMFVNWLYYIAYCRKDYGIVSNMNWLHCRPRQRHTAHCQVHARNSPDDSSRAQYLLQVSTFEKQLAYDCKIAWRGYTFTRLLSQTGGNDHFPRLRWEFKDQRSHFQGENAAGGYFGPVRAPHSDSAVCASELHFYHYSVFFRSA